MCISIFLTVGMWSLVYLHGWNEKWDIGCCFTILLADISQHCCPKQCKSGVRRSSGAKLIGHCCWKREVLLSFSSACLPACWPCTPSTSLALSLYSSVPSVSCSSSNAVKAHQQLFCDLMSWAGSLQGHLDFRDAQARRTWLHSCRQVQRRGGRRVWDWHFWQQQASKLSWLPLLAASRANPAAVPHSSWFFLSPHLPPCASTSICTANWWTVPGSKARPAKPLPSSDQDQLHRWIAGGQEEWGMGVEGKDSGVLFQQQRLLKVLVKVHPCRPATVVKP